MRFVCFFCRGCAAYLHSRKASAAPNASRRKRRRQTTATAALPPSGSQGATNHGKDNVSGSRKTRGGNKVMNASHVTLAAQSDLNSLVRCECRCATVISAVKREKGKKREAACFCSGLSGNDLSITLGKNSFITHKNNRDPQHRTKCS